MIAFQQVRNLYVAELRAAEQRYFRNLGSALTDGKLDSRRWWMKAKKACGWSTPREVLPQSVGDKLVTCPQEKAEVFNEHFCRQCSTSPSAVFPSCPDLPLQSLQATLAFNFLKCLLWISLNLLLRSLPSGKSAGPDNITNELLKLSAPAISESLAAIVNDSLTLGIFPRAAMILERVDCVACAESWQRCHKACVVSSNLPPKQRV